MSEKQNPAKTMWITIMFIGACMILMVVTETGPFKPKLSDKLEYVSDSCKHEVKRALNNQ